MLNLLKIIDMKPFVYVLVFFILSVIGLSLLSADLNHLSEEEAEVNAAILDYVEGIYTLDTSRIYRSVHPELAKRGYYFAEKKDQYSGKLDMSFQQLVDLTKSWNKDGRAGEDALKEIKIFEINDKTASAKLTAYWGIDLFHLAKIDGKWMIMNVLWQSPPRM